MFDTDKIYYLTEHLQKISSEFDNVYIIYENIFLSNTVALFRRLKLPIRAIMHDTIPQKEIFGLPVVKTAETSANFNERTALIIITQKPLPIIKTTLDFNVKGEIKTIPSVVMTNEEAVVIYDRLMMLKFIQLYAEDKIFEIKEAPYWLPERFARGFTTLLHPHYQNFKYQRWDSRVLFKPTYEFDDTAIVIQGPIEYTNNYTVETFKLYRSIYPNVPIVVSTWKDEAIATFRRECRENSITLLENDPPNFAGSGNIDMQLKSSLQGVKYIKENTSAKFVLKTRTDQRINYFEFLVYFKNLLETFPPKGNKLKKRIILLESHNTKIYPFSYHDFLAFGHIDDISKLYDIPFHGNQDKLNYLSRHRKRIKKINTYLGSPDCGFDYNSATKQSHKLYKLNKMMNRIYSAEMYITRTFYEKYIAPVDETKLFETSWKFIVDYLILIDFDLIKLDWEKYEKMRYKLEFAYGIHNAFARWLDMYKNFKIDWV